MRTYKQKKNTKNRNTIKIYGSGNTFGKTKKPDNPNSPLEHRVPMEPPPKPPKPTPLEIKIETGLKNYIDILTQLEDLNNKDIYYSKRNIYNDIPFSLKKFDYPIKITTPLNEREDDKNDWLNNTSDNKKYSVSIPYRTKDEMELRIIDIIILDTIFTNNLEDKYLSILEKHFKSKLLFYAAYRNNIDIMKWALEHNFNVKNIGEIICQIAIINNYVDLLLFAIENGANCEFETTRYILDNHPKLLKTFLDLGCNCNSTKYNLLPAIAAGNGDLDNLKIIHQNIKIKCRWGTSTCWGAAANGKLECLKYAHENGCPWDSMTTSSAAENGHLECLKYANENGCPWDYETCVYAATNGHLECLKYAHENGCPWNEKVCIIAAENGHLECLKYANENGCPWTEKVCEAAARTGQLECLKYAHENGCPWDSYTTYASAVEGHLNCLKYAHENGCPWDEDLIYSVINNFNLEILIYATKNGCPCDVDFLIPNLQNNLAIMNNSKLIDNNIEKAKITKKIINYLNSNKNLFVKPINPKKSSFQKEIFKNNTNKVYKEIFKNIHKT
jgi:hypothetical protein